jgi:hypothetical protein
VNDEDVADNEATEKEKIDKYKESEMIDREYQNPCYIRVKGLVPLYYQLGVALNDHVGGALVELHVRVLSLPEHEGLGKTFMNKRHALEKAIKRIHMCKPG